MVKNTRKIKIIEQFAWKKIMIVSALINHENYDLSYSIMCVNIGILGFPVIP